MSERSVTRKLCDHDCDGAARQVCAVCDLDSCKDHLITVREGFVGVLAPTPSELSFKVCRSCVSTAFPNLHFPNKRISRFPSALVAEF